MGDSFRRAVCSLTDVNEAVKKGNECGMRRDKEKRKPTDAFLVEYYQHRRRN